MGHRNHAQGKTSFGLMAAQFKLRDAMRPPARILEEAGVRAGMTVLDLGCGPGSFSVAAARLVGPAGTVYALDTNPIAIRSVRRAAERKRLHNIAAILGGDLLVIPPRSCDVALLHDVLHGLSDSLGTVAGVRRILRDDGVLVVGDHHMTDDRIVSEVTSGGLFTFSRRLAGFQDISCFEPVKAGVKQSQ